MLITHGEAPKSSAGKKGDSKKPLRALLPYGMLATRKWLMARGLSGHALDNAVKSKRLLPLAPGVYSQYTRDLRWEGVVASLQYMEGASTPSVYAGGLTALSVMEMPDLPPAGALDVHLYANDRPPAWLFRLPLPEKFKWRSAKNLWPESVAADEDYLEACGWDMGLPPLHVSCPERALMEALMSVPKGIDFDQADGLMREQILMSPRKLDALLGACRSVKVKRLFFWLAARANHHWLGDLDRARYDLGSGKRVLEEGGKLDREHLITVPHHMAGGERER